jgi:DNA mismatch endonuclease (patch repair protein)
MSDVVSPEVRSRMMAGIKGKNTRPEIQIRKLLFAAGYRFRLHRRDLPGTPDIVMPGKRIAVFVHGCFWHGHQGCKLAKIPSTRTDFWTAKIKANILRDRMAIDQLLLGGWRVLVVWECAVREKGSATDLMTRIGGWIESDRREAHIAAFQCVPAA